MGGIGEQFFPGGMADENTAVGGKVDHGGHQRRLAIGTADAYGLAVAQTGHETVGGAEVDANDDILRLVEAAVVQVNGKSGHEQGLIRVDKG